MKTIDEIIETLSEENFPAAAITISRDGTLNFYDSGSDARTFAHMHNEIILFDVDEMSAERIEYDEFLGMLQRNEFGLDLENYLSN